MKQRQLFIHKEDGFTIIELLVATSIFTAVLLTLMFGIVEISRVYYRGITETNTQNTARNIMNTITQALQFDGSFTVGSASSSGGRTYQTYCMGGYQFTYLPGYQLEPTVPPTTVEDTHALVVSGVSSPTCPSAQLLNPGAPINGTELLAQHMRIANFTITPSQSTPGIYSVDLRLVYGDDDLLCNEAPPPVGVPGSCLTTTTMVGAIHYSGTGVTCRLRTADQFCAVSDLSTIVQSRVN